MRVKVGGERITLTTATRSGFRNQRNQLNLADCDLRLVGAREVTDALLREGGPGPVLLTALASEALAKEGVDLDDRGRPFQCTRKALDVQPQ